MCLCVDTTHTSHSNHPSTHPFPPPLFAVPSFSTKKKKKEEEEGEKTIR